jgi:hypothetical protein
MRGMARSYARFLARMAGSVVLAGAAVSCSASKDTPPDFPDPDVAGHDTNPDGLAYPTDHIGGNPHHSRVAGDRIPNFTFQAYVDGDRAAGLKTISLADYFDPQQKRNKVLHIEVSAVWCTICSSVTSETVKIKEELAKEGVVYLEVMTAGNRAGAGPSLGEVDDWVTRHSSNITTAIDVSARRMASIGVDPGVRPWDVVVDTRTMEILESSGGSPIDVATYDRSYLKVVASYAPAY